jgi:hypothetical protein
MSLITELPMRSIQKNNISKYNIYNRCKNTLECYYDSENKKSYIVKYNQEWRTLFLIKNIDNTYIDFSIYKNGHNYKIIINKFNKYFQKYKIKYIVNEKNLHNNVYCKYSIKNIISEILTTILKLNTKIHNI